jgi:formylglycine-generating enzyme
MNKLLLGVLLTLSTVAVAKDKNEKKNTEKNHEMIAVKGGKFDMGSDDEAMDRRPAHTVTLKDFSIGKYEVTEAQFRAIMGNEAVTFPHCDQCPVTNISWNDAQTYILKLNAATGHQYRLPTEAEWEFAAQGGRERNRENAKKYSGKRVLQYIAWFEKRQRTCARSG